MAKQIISITDNAAEQIKKLLAARSKPAIGIKIKVKTGGCSGLTYHIEYADQLEKYDEIVNEQEITVVIEAKACMYLMGTTMDYVIEKMKEGFVFINPNEKGRCGCGESFRV